ncbi:MAG: hypothetical protein V4722_23430 [Bacteroidota bacterium]
MKKIITSISSLLLTQLAFTQVGVSLLSTPTTQFKCVNCPAGAGQLYQFKTTPVLTGAEPDAQWNVLVTEFNDRTTKRFRQYVEFGDGYFSNDFTTGAGLETKLARVVPGGNYKPLVITYALYTPVPPTALLSEFTSFSRSPGDDAKIVQTKILAPGNVGIVPSIGTIIPNDLVTFAIPFKRSTSDTNGVLIFLYNNNDNPINIFKKATLNQTLTFPTDIAGATVTFAAIRGTGTNNGFSARVTGTATTDISYRIRQQLGAEADGFRDALVIDVSALKDDIEHNIFISLQTNSSRILLSAEAKPTILTKALFVPYSSGQGAPEDNRTYSFAGGKNMAFQNLNLSLSARDPNNTSISPNCVKTGSTNQSFTFNMRVTNEGPGPAHSVWIQPHFRNTRLRLRNIEMVQAIIGGKKWTGKLMKQDTIFEKGKLLQPGQLIINLDSLGVDSAFTFTETDTILPILLAGMRVGTNPDTYQGNDVAAFITFKATVDQLPDQVDSSFLVAEVSFDSPSGMTPPYSTPQPGRLSIENDCEPTTNVRPGTDPCDSFWCQSWWLILLLLLALLLIIYFYLRRKKRNR